MELLSKYRVLVVCGGNTCRSPVLAFLLQRELHKIGCQNVEVLSAGAREDLARNADRMKDFAIEALLNNLSPPKDENFQEIMLRAHKHESQGLSRLRGQNFGLIVLAEDRYREKLSDNNVMAGRIRVLAPPVLDDAFDVWEQAGRPSSIAEDSSGEVLRAYEDQTAVLRRHAAYFVSEIRE